MADGFSKGDHLIKHEFDIKGEVETEPGKGGASGTLENPQNP